MVDRFRIEEMLTVAGNSLVYVDVAFLEDGRVVHRNDFLMALWPTSRKYVGRVGPDGEHLDKGPEYYEIRPRNVVVEILDNIRRYADRASMEVPDNRSGSIRTEDSDPLGIRIRPEVAALIGVEVEL